MILSPSLLNAGIKNLSELLSSLEKMDVPYLHIDVMDGHFVPNLSFGPGTIQALKSMTTLKLDVHLMIENPENLIPDFVQAGSDIITIHHESTPHTFYAIQNIKLWGKKAGIAINPGTSIENIKPLLNRVDQVLVMTINPGRNNQTFIKESLDKIKELVQYRKENNLSFDIQVDGNITDKTIRPCLEAGANVIVSGGYIFNSNNFKDRIQTLQEISYEYERKL